MSKWIKKALEVEAYQWNADEPGNEYVPDWITKALLDYTIIRHRDGLQISTLEGPLVCRKGDWIVKGVEGELYPVKGSIFKKTYDQVKP